MPDSPPARTRRTKRPAADVPLGSLTQLEHRSSRLCTSCGSDRVTRLSMSLADGAPVDFSSCRRCGHRSWQQDGVVLSVADVLARSARPAAQRRTA